MKQEFSGGHVLRNWFLALSGDEGRAVVDYMAAISMEAGLSVEIVWDGVAASFFSRDSPN